MRRSVMILNGHLIFRLALLPIFFAFYALADIKQVQTMEEALAPVDDETLLIFDLDNTIMETTQTLGSDQWFEHYVHGVISDLVKAGKSKEDATKEGLQTALAVWKRIQQVTTMQLVEPNTAKLVREKQSKIRVMGLTARPGDLSSTTRKQLLSLAVDLNLSPVSKDVLIQKADHADYEAKLEKGILFSGNNKKGEMLVKLLERIQLSPKKIVFVDDKQRNVDSVEKSLNELGGILHTSMRYGAADSKVAAFDAKLAGVQFQFFGKILTDRAAAAILNN